MFFFQLVLFLLGGRSGLNIIIFHVAFTFGTCSCLKSFYSHVLPLGAFSDLALVRGRQCRPLDRLSRRGTSPSWSFCCSFGVFLRVHLLNDVIYVVVRRVESPHHFQSPVEIICKDNTERYIIKTRSYMLKIVGTDQCCAKSLCRTGRSPSWVWAA